MPVQHGSGWKFMYSIAGAVGLLVICQFLLLWREFLNLDDQKLTLEAQVESKQRQLDEYEMKVREKERDVHRMEMRLREMEARLKTRKNRVSGPQITIFMITPTHNTPNQRADLTRLSQTLMHVPDLRWILIEDSYSMSLSIAQLLNDSGLQYTHLNAITPANYKMNSEDANWKYPRGVVQRNLGLSWIRTNIAESAKGVVFFGDDDNTYDLKLFMQMRTIWKVGVWPVGIVGGLMVEKPVVDSQGKVSDFVVGWKPDRPFPIDMAAFAVNVSLIHAYPQAGFSHKVPRGYQESHILQGLGLARSDLEPKAKMCTKVYVWHTRTEKVKLKDELVLNAKGIHSDDGIIV